MNETEEGTIRQRLERARDGQARCKTRLFELRREELKCIEEETGFLSEEIRLLKEMDKKEKEMKKEK